MLLPHRQRAYVPEPKLTRYLLALSHPVGGPKARFFRAHGFDAEQPDLLEEELLRVARENDVVSVEDSPHGTKHVVDGSLKTPRGTPVRVRTVWIQDKQSRPRFVTAYPAP